MGQDPHYELVQEWPARSGGAVVVAAELAGSCVLRLKGTDSVRPSLTARTLVGDAAEAVIEHQPTKSPSKKLNF